MDLLDYPKTEAENVRWRDSLLEIAEERDAKGAYTAAALEMQNACIDLSKANKFFFFNAFLWTYDPRPDRGMADKPFCTYKRQNDFLRWLDGMYAAPNNVSGFGDKARDVGCSYVCIGWSLWHWLFDDSFNAHLGSRKEDLVYKAGDPDTLFYKLRYMTERLPKWMLPPGFDINRNHKFMMQDRPDNGNTITGESANPDFGRGGRHSFTLLDEFGFWQWARPAWESCGQSSHFRLAVTTPPTEGVASHAYKLRSAQVGNVDVFTFDYNSVPWKDFKWLEGTKDGTSNDEYQREIRRSYQGTTAGRIYATEWASVRRDPKLTYNPMLPLYCSWDFGFDGTGIIWWQKDYRTNWNYVIDCYFNQDKPILFYVPFVTGTIGSGFHYEPWELRIIGRHKQWVRPHGHFGDPNVKSRNMVTNTSLKDELAKPPYNIYVETHVWTKDTTHYSIREKAKMMMTRTTMNPVACVALDEAMENSRYPERSETGKSTATVKKPVHDQYSHLRTAFEYYVVNEPTDEPPVTVNSVPAGMGAAVGTGEPEFSDDNSFSSIDMA